MNRVEQAFIDAKFGVLMTGVGPEMVDLYLDMEAREIARLDRSADDDSDAAG